MGTFKRYKGGYKNKLCVSEKAHRTNSTFGFCQHISQPKKTKRAVSCQRSDGKRNLNSNFKN
ncbi:MAG: hypothetical protein RBS19_12035 [Bacteroidales bacterium]|nr:hypothetical protein [Bacteroidales bacterium]